MNDKNENLPSEAHDQLEFPVNDARSAEFHKDPKRAAFGRFLKVDLYDVFGEHDMSDLTESEKKWMNPRNLAANLFGRSYRELSTLDGVALNGYEYKLIARSPKKLAETAITNTLAADSQAVTVNDELIARSKRAGVHALEGKLPGIESHREALRQTRTEIQILKRQAEMPGYAHKSALEMTRLLNIAWSEFMTILDAVHIQQKWNDETRHRAESTLIHYLTSGPQSTRTKHWKDMLGLASNYIDNRVGIMTKKIKQIKEELSKLQPDESEENI